MCNPVLIVGAVSTALSMAGKFIQYRQESKAAQASADYNSKIAADQAATSQRLAQAEIQKGEADRERYMRSAVRDQGDRLSLLGSSGFNVDSGSGLSLLADSAQEHQYDANIITQNSSWAAWQHQANANQSLNQQGWYNYQKKNAKGSSLAQGLAMGGSLLGGISSGMDRMG